MVIYFKSILSVLILFILIGCFGEETGQSPISINGQTMGTTYNVTVVDNPLRLSKENLKKRIEKTLNEVNDKMSNWYDQSEISIINNDNRGKPIDLSQELFDVIKLSTDIHIRSNGAFDITAAPLINLWGFGPNKSERKIPSVSEVNAALELVGQTKLLKLMTGLNQLKKRNSEVSINLSAIAKGYGIDRVASTLKKQKIQNFLVEIGGDLITSGTNKNGKAWSIGIEAPNFGSQIVQSVIKIKDQAMATSGDYKNFFERNEIRYSHIIDPKTGYPIRHKTLSVTVLAKSAALADGWATAMLVLGNNDGMIIANKLNLPVFFISSHEKTFITASSEEFKKIAAGSH
ncbi:MAG: thiamine biosynthesis protein ApbE [Rhodospirillaceae bacterium]|nr:thiamine biosynthesis protein ApbE [Rhodospirillaceae bacterium]